MKMLYFDQSHCVRINMPKTFRIFFAFILVFFVSSTFATNLQVIEQELSDSVITTKIKAKFTKNKDLNPLKISVNTENGVVNLSGYVKNKEAFVLALRLASNTTGVKTVDTEHLE